jgi:hypothetical protein
MIKVASNWSHFSRFFYLKVGSTTNSRQLVLVFSSVHGVLMPKLLSPVTPSCTAIHLYMGAWISVHPDSDGWGLIKLPKLWYNSKWSSIILKTMSYLTKRFRIISCKRFLSDKIHLYPVFSTRMKRLKMRTLGRVDYKRGSIIVLYIVLL